MFKVLLSVVGLLGVVKCQTQAECETGFDVAMAGCNGESICLNLYTCLQSDYCPIWADSHTSISAAISAQCSTTNGCTYAFICDMDLAIAFSKVLGCFCTYHDVLGSDSTTITNEVSSYQTLLQTYCNADIAIDCSGGTSLVTIPAYTTTFTLTFGTWDWSAYNETSFAAFKDTLKVYIAKALGVLSSQVTINWMLQTGGARRLVSADAEIEIVTASQHDADTIKNSVTGSAFTNSVSSDTGAGDTQTSNAVTSDSSEAYDGSGTIVTTQAPTFIETTVSILGATPSPVTNSKTSNAYKNDLSVFSVLSAIAIAYILL